MASKKNAISKTTSNDFRGVAKVASSPLRDLALSRQLTQRALDEGNVSSACLFAIASAKLLGPCMSHAVDHDELLSPAALGRAATNMIHLLAEWLEEKNVDSFQEVVDHITTRFSNEIQKAHHE